MKVIAVDWGKDARKRSAYLAEPSERRIFRLPFDVSLSHLVEYASSIEPPVLIGIDAAIGFPDASWQMLTKTGPFRSDNFIDFLLSDLLPADFFDPVTKPEDWSPHRPFVRPPRGSWSLKAYVKASDDGFYRRIDSHLNGNPIFVTSGIPGSVGSGTRALWQELIAIGKKSKLRVRCPIPGCTHVFKNTRGGWDAHVASVARHPEWHPDVLEATKRKRLFKSEFPHWFTDCTPRST